MSTLSLRAVARALVAPAMIPAFPAPARGQARAPDLARINKLLVLIDGRSIYTHAFSGVLWHEEDLLLDDIDRIEVNLFDPEHAEYPGIRPVVPTAMPRAASVGLSWKV